MEGEDQRSKEMNRGCAVEGALEGCFGVGCLLDSCLSTVAVAATAAVAALLLTRRHRR